MYNSVTVYHTIRLRATPFAIAARQRMITVATLVCVVAGLVLPARPAVAWQAAPDPGYWLRSDLPQMGLATFYARGMMEYVVSYRQQHGQLPSCPDCVGAVALLRAGDIGRKVWLQLPGSNEVAGPFLVVDCARREDVSMLVDRNWVVDVSYEVGQTWKMTGPLAGVIVWPDPAEGTISPPPVQPAQLYVDPAAVVISTPTAESTQRPGRLPTRLPVPPSVAGPSPDRPAPLTPVITTPTPAGFRETPAMPASETTAISGSLAGDAGGEREVSLGRPGQELLLRAARPASFLQPPTIAPRTEAVETDPQATPTAKITGAPTPVRSVTPTGPARQPRPGEEDLLSRIWRTILGMLSVHPSP